MVKLKLCFLRQSIILQPKFTLVQSDLSYVSFDNLLAIVLEPKKVSKGKIIYYHFDKALDIFEKLVTLIFQLPFLKYLIFFYKVKL